MTNQVEVEIFIAMNEEGGWIVTADEGETLNLLGEEQGGYQARVVKLKVLMTPPTMTEATVTVPNEVGELSAQAA